MGIWIRTGTVALSNGSPDVTGTGTGFLAAGVQPGYEFRDAAGVAYEVLSVTSDTLLTLTQTYAGATASGAAYTIVPMSYAANAAVFSKVMALLSMLSSNVQATSLKLGDPSIGDAVLAAKGLRHSFENSGDINLDVIKGAGTDEAFLRFLAGETVGGRIGLDAAGALVIDCGNGMRVPVLSEDPVDPANGSIWYLIGTNKFRCCENGTKRNLFGAESGTYEAGAGLALDDDTFSVAAGGVTRAMLADATALSVIGRSADSAGAPADIAIDANGKYIGRRGNAVGGYQIAAGEIANTAAGNIAATNVQAALNELDGDKQPTSAKLTALAALEGGAGKSVVFAGDDSLKPTTPRIWGARSPLRRMRPRHAPSSAWARVARPPPTMSASPMAMAMRLRRHRAKSSSSAPPRGLMPSSMMTMRLTATMFCLPSTGLRSRPTRHPMDWPT